jgi:hypothetical protein
LEIESATLKFQVSLVETGSLKPHEEIIEPLAKSLARTIQSEGVVRDPIIVDKRELVILDGMHRHAALKLLKCRFAPCCLVDYDNPQIKLNSWFRLFITKQTERVVRDVLDENKLRYVEQGSSFLETRKNPRTVIFTGDGRSYRLQQSLDPFELTKTAVLLERRFSDRGYRVDYQSEETAFDRLESGKADLVIAVPVFVKEDIRRFGIEGRLLPHKVTRHVMPSRPLRLNAPLKMLKEPSTHDQMEKKFSVLLSLKKIETRPPGSIVDGRRYEEELLIFRD